MIPEPWSYTKDYVSTNFEDSPLAKKTDAVSSINEETEQILTADGEKIDMTDGEESLKGESERGDSTSQLNVPTTLPSSVDQCRTTMVIDFSLCPPSTSPTTSETIYEPVDATEDVSRTTTQNCLYFIYLFTLQ